YVPIRLGLDWRGVLINLVPVVRNLCQRRFQPRLLKTFGAFAQPSLAAIVVLGWNNGQTVMGDNQPTDRRGQRCPLREVAKGLTGDVVVHAIAEIAARRYPVLFAAVFARQTRQPRRVLVVAHKGQEQAQGNPLVAVAIAFGALAFEALLALPRSCSSAANWASRRMSSAVCQSFSASFRNTSRSVELVGTAPSAL